MFSEKERLENKASGLYREITLPESGSVKRLSLIFIFLNLAVFFAIPIIIRADQLNIGKYPILYKSIPIGCELIYIVLERSDERKFNKLVKNGIILKTTIDHNQSRAMITGFCNGLLIHSHYICENGTRLDFMQMKNYHVNSRLLDIPRPPFLFEKKLKKEQYVNVLVNPVEYNTLYVNTRGNPTSEYYILVSEIGMEPDKKTNVHYSNKTVNTILLFILLTEYLIWIICY